MHALRSITSAGSCTSEQIGAGRRLSVCFVWQTGIRYVTHFISEGRHLSVLETSPDC